MTIVELLSKSIIPRWKKIKVALSVLWLKQVVTKDKQNKDYKLSVSLIKDLLTIVTIVSFQIQLMPKMYNRCQSFCWINAQQPNARLTASGRSSGRAHVNWNWTSFQFIPEPNSAYQALSLMWGERWRAVWASFKPEAEHQSSEQRSDQYGLIHGPGRLAQWAVEWQHFLIDLGSSFVYKAQSVHLQSSNLRTVLFSSIESNQIM